MRSESEKLHSGSSSPANQQPGSDQKAGENAKDSATGKNGDQNGAKDQASNLPPTEQKPAADNTAKPEAGKAAEKNPSNDKADQNGQAQRVAGQISPEEARNLLDSMRSELRRFPTGPVVRTNQPSDDKPKKDW